MKFIFFGAGYCSRFVIPLLPMGTEIICTHNEAIKKQENDKMYSLKRLKLKDFLKKKDFYMENVSCILNSIPPSQNGDIILKKLSNLIISNKKTLQWYGYFSSTSVYGNHDGKWVDELSNTAPTSKRGILRLETENSHLDLFKSMPFPLHIFRLPGIYGPGRSVFDKIKNNEIFEIIKENHYFSRIHVDDIASAILKSISKPTPGEIFNLTDDHPCQSSEVVRFASTFLKKIKVKKINFDDEKLNKKTQSFYKDNKKVKNKKIKKILGWTPKYRNYKLGLRSIYNLIK
jgi:nucleoside-diphosphate-sugar epimerase|tara:strand:+ start:3865 stop:4728 length:864 start_codon:yes stop_codon:yes gene_type:complete